MKLAWNCLLVSAVLSVGMGRLQAQTKPADEPMTVAELARGAGWNVGDNGAAMLARRDLAEADRKQIAAIMARAVATAERLAAEAGDRTIDPKSTRADLEKLKQQFATPASKEYTEFMASRGDLEWMQARAGVIQRVEWEMLSKRTGEYLQDVEDAGIDAERAKAVGKIVDALRDDLDQHEKLRNAAYVLAADGPARRKVLLESLDGVGRKLTAACTSIRALLTPAQVEALEWQFQRHYHGIPDYLKIGFSTQGQEFVAPEDGEYYLEVYPGRAVLAKVPLTKGRALGFRRTPTTLKAFAGFKEFDIPAGATVYWILNEE